MTNSFRNLTEPLIETPRERRAPDGVGMNVRLDGTGTTDGSGRFVCGGSVPLREGKWVKGCMARIVLNYLAFRKWNRTLVARNFARCAMPVPRSQIGSLTVVIVPVGAASSSQFQTRKPSAFAADARARSAVMRTVLNPGTHELDLPCFTLTN
jgi:hypothetical protein